MSSSFFGLTCKRGGWDCMRHYEIMASGALLLFRDYYDKPRTCSPVDLPCFSYSTYEELWSIINRLVIDGEVTDEYVDMLLKQREWLLKYGTTEARALDLIQKIQSNKNKL